MAFTINNLADYVKGHGEILISDVVLGSPSFSWIPIQTGIKDTDKLIDLSDTETAIKKNTDYSGISNASGGTTLADVSISVDEYWVKEFYTSRELEAKVAGLAMRRGSNPDDLPFKDAIIDLKGRTIRLENEKTIWSTFDTAIVGTGTTAISGASASAVTTTNAVSYIEDFAQEGIDQFGFYNTDSVVVASQKAVQNYMRAKFGLNSVLDKDTLQTGAEFKDFVNIPGMNVTLYGSPGITGNTIYFTRPENLRIGVDLESDFDRVDFEYHSVLKKHELFILWKLGAKVVRPSEVYYYA